MIVDGIATIGPYRGNPETDEVWMKFILPQSELFAAARLLAYSGQEVVVFYRLQDNSMYELCHAQWNGLVQTPKFDYRISVRTTSDKIDLTEHMPRLKNVSFTLRICDIADYAIASVNEKLGATPEPDGYGTSALVREDREDLVPDELELSTETI